MPRHKQVGTTLNIHRPEEQATSATDTGLFSGSVPGVVVVTQYRERAGQSVCGISAIFNDNSLLWGV